MTSPLHLVYGMPPPTLVTLARDVCQCSPLIPGSLALEACAPASVASATVYAPPGTIERRYVLAQVLRALAPGTSLTALAPKDKGGSRLVAELESFGCEVVAHSRSHHRIVETTCPAELRGIDEAIAEGALRQYPGDGMWTQPGIFSWDRVDVGSALLLKHLPALRGVGADLGCGLGVLARAVLQSPSVTALTLVDSDARAIAAAKRNITDLHAHFIWADIRHGVALSGLDFVVMNPPFHDAGIEDQSLGQLFIVRAAEILKAGGTLWCVANRHLPYESMLAARFSRVTRVAEADGFKIFMAEK